MRYMIIRTSIDGPFAQTKEAIDRFRKIGVGGQGRAP